MGQKALLVGINRYKMAGADLQGCVNDVTNIRDVLLKYFGFKVKDIRMVVDDRATKKAIMDRLSWLVKGARAGDRLLFHFSGHGSQIRDRDGDELKDHLDEILCPHDMDWDGTYIVDDQLAKVFAKVPKGVNLEVLLDSCHSGTGTREMTGLGCLPPELAFRPRFLRPPADILSRVEDDLPVRKLLSSFAPNSERPTPNPGLVLFSGCRDNQTSADAEIKGKYNGAFTYYFCGHLRDVKGEISRADLLKRLRASLRFEGFEQTPQLECPTVEKKKKVLE